MNKFAIIIGFPDSQGVSRAGVQTRLTLQRWQYRAATKLTRIMQGKIF
jgi:hypothetical protein